MDSIDSGQSGQCSSGKKSISFSKSVPFRRAKEGLPRNLERQSTLERGSKSSLTSIRKRFLRIKKSGWRLIDTHMYQSAASRLDTGSHFLRENANFDETETVMEKIMGSMLYFLAWFTFMITFPMSLFFVFKVAKEYERVVIFRLGKLLPGSARGPGPYFILPCIDSYRKIDLRVMSYDVPPQEILSKDCVTVSVDAVVYFRTCAPILSVNNVNDASYSTKLLAQTTLRNILGTKTLSEMLSDRDTIAQQAQKVLDEGTDPWGIKVDRVEVKDIRLPAQLHRVMAAEAEASREARAKVIAAEGEHRASHCLRNAADVMAKSRAALQLRYLQTLADIATEHKSTILFPMFIKLLYDEDPVPKKGTISKTEAGGKEKRPPPISEIRQRTAAEISGIVTEPGSRLEKKSSTMSSSKSILELEKIFS